MARGTLYEETRPAPTSEEQPAVAFPVNPVIAIVALVAVLMVLWTVVWATIGPV